MVGDHVSVSGYYFALGGSVFRQNDHRCAADVVDLEPFGDAFCVRQRFDNDSLKKRTE